MELKRIKVAIITGTRAEFGIFHPVIAAIRAHAALRLQLIVTGTHLLRCFGYTLSDIHAAKIPIAATVPMYRGREPAADSLARGTRGMAAAFRKLRPDIVLVLGDRLEILAGANAALACQIPIAHLHGGETAPGQWDEQIRHAVTKMAHLHFCATKTSARRIRQMGEDPARIHVVGAPALDFANKVARAMGAVRRSLGPVVVLHPTSRDDRVEYRRTKMLLKALKASPQLDQKTLIVIGPNNDPGHRGILQAYAEDKSRFAFQLSVPQGVFWTALNASGLLIGNSSSGIIEAATFGCAVINIGDRQAGRERSGNVIDVPWSVAAIGRALRRVLSDNAFQRRVALRKNVYGDGHAATRIAKILSRLAAHPLPPTKQFHDLP